MAKFILVLGLEDISDRVCDSTGGIVDIERITTNRGEKEIIDGIIAAMGDTEKMAAVHHDFHEDFSAIAQKMPFAGLIEDEVTIYFTEP